MTKNLALIRLETIAIATIIVRSRRFFPEIDRDELSEQIRLAHSASPLMLQALANAKPSDLIHDILGIRQHMDPITGEMNDCFICRYSIGAPA